MRLCVKTSRTICSIHASARCKPACTDDMDQSECICGNEKFPEKWAKPTCGGSTTTTPGKNHSRRKTKKIHSDYYLVQ